MNSQTDAVFRSLADPIRRQILDLLAEEGPLTVSQLSGEIPAVVTSNISKHLMTLRATGLVAATRRGREQVYRLEAEVLGAALAPWIVKYERFWSAALLRLRDLSESAASTAPTNRSAATRAAARRRR